MSRLIWSAAAALALALAGAEPALPANFQDGANSKGGADSKGAAEPKISAKPKDDAEPVVVGRSGYYPLEVGSEWRYGINGQTVVARVTKHEKIAGHAAGKVDSHLGERLLSSEHIAVTPEGVFRVAFDGSVPTKPVLILKLPPKDGDVWAVETKMEGNVIKGSARCDREKVKVPAGEFDAYRVSGHYVVTTPDGTELKPEFTFWFAEGTGVVKLGTKSGDSEVVLGLESFKKGK